MQHHGIFQIKTSAKKKLAQILEKQSSKLKKRWIHCMITFISVVDPQFLRKNLFPSEECSLHEITKKNKNTNNAGRPVFFSRLDCLIHAFLFDVRKCLGIYFGGLIDSMFSFFLFFPCPNEPKILPRGRFWKMH